MTHIVKPSGVQWDFQMSDAGGIEDVLAPNGTRTYVARHTVDSSGYFTGLSGLNNSSIPLGFAANTIAFVGDSFLARWLNTPTATSQATSPSGFPSWALNLSRRRFYPVASPCTGGSGLTAAFTGTQISTTQMDAAIASGAKNILIMGGVNDAINNVALADMKAAYLLAIRKGVAAGIRMWVGTQPTMNAAYAFYTVAIQAKCMELNYWLKTRVATAYAENGVTVIDVAGAVNDPASATGDYKANYTSDNLHPNNLGGYFGGKEIARVWALTVPEVPPLIASNADNYGYSSTISNIQDNGLFVASGGGVGTGFTVTNGGTASNVPTIVSRSDGFGNDQQIAVTSNAVNDQSILNGTDVKARCSAGDTLVAQLEVTTTTITVLKWLQLVLFVNGATSNFTSTDMAIGGTDVAFTENFTMTMQTPPYTITAAQGALSLVQAQLNIRCSAAGAATVKVGKFCIRKWPTA